MFTIKVTKNDKSEALLRFKEFSRRSVMAKYNQLVSQGDLLDFEEVV